MKRRVGYVFYYGIIATRFNINEEEDIFRTSDTFLEINFRVLTLFWR